MKAKPRLYRKMTDLGPRLASALVLGGVAYGAIWFGGWSFAVFVALAAGVMGWEWHRMSSGANGKYDFICFGLCLGYGGAILIAHYFMTIGFAFAYSLGFVWLLLVLAGGVIWDLLCHSRIRYWGILGGVVIGLSSLSLVLLRHKFYGFETVLWLVSVVIATDVGGYFAGHLIGGPKLAPRLSPKKTWAGVMGGMGLSCGIGAIFSAATTGTYLFQVCLISILVALVSIMGDLLESAAKRHFGVKDSSALIPGHGGALDRLDGLMAATLFVAFVTLLRDKEIFIW